MNLFAFKAFDLAPLYLEVDQGADAIDGRPLKVLIVSDYMSPQTHGIATHCGDLVSALREVGCEVGVFTTCGESGKDRHMLWSFANPFNKDVRTALVPSLALCHACLFGDWDVVHILFPSLIGWPVLFLSWLSGKATYVSHHCNEELGKRYLCSFFYACCFIYSILVATLPSLLFATVNAGATASFKTAHYVYRCLAPDRLDVVPSSVDASLFHTTEASRSADRLALRRRLGLDDRPVWLVVARLAVEKNIPEVIEALRVHAELYPDEAQPALVIAGDGPQRSALEALANDVVGSSVHFLGWVAHDEVAQLYRASDACVTFSTQETFGLTVIEAMACGCPQVLPHCEVFDELYGDAISSWMYTSGNAESLARSLHAAALPAAHDRLEELKRTNSFGPHIFWSWNAAAHEQVAQYRRAVAVVSGGATHRRCCRRLRGRTPRDAARPTNVPAPVPVDVNTAAPLIAPV